MAVVCVTHSSSLNAEIREFGDVETAINQLCEMKIKLNLLREAKKITILLVRYLSLYRLIASIKVHSTLVTFN